MAIEEAQTSELERDRLAIQRAGKLNAIHWAVVALSLVVTFGAWQFAKRQVEERYSIRFERASAHIVDLVRERMQKYEDGLWGGVSAINALGGKVSYDEWRAFADTLQLDVKYPGINGIGVIFDVPLGQRDAFVDDQRRRRPDFTPYPQHDRAAFMPITYIEPVDINARAVGLDMAHETNRFTAALRARDSGRAQITGPIVLVQDKTQTPGFLFYAPFYTKVPDQAPADSVHDFGGLVYAPFVFHKLMEGVLGKDRRDVRIRVRDAETVLYDESEGQEAEASSDYQRSVDLNVYGRTWRFDIWATPAFAGHLSSNQPNVILFGGIAIDTLLLATFIIFSRANRRAVRFADRMTAELRARTRNLEASNGELERFAYVAAHDLRAPLRGIGDLTEYLEEDLEDYLMRPEANPDVRRNLGRLQTQTRRMDALIRGILDYSSLSGEPEPAQPVDTGAVLSELESELALKPAQLTRIGRFPVLKTDRVRFEQVLGNLLGNAKKYHHDPERLAIEVEAREDGAFHVFSVSDNGPGIDPKYHEKIFDAFAKLQSNDDVESTGIGLSVVKKIVEQCGGEVWVSSEAGRGARFSFSWPMAASQDADRADEASDKSLAA